MFYKWLLIINDKPIFRFLWLSKGKGFLLYGGFICFIFPKSFLLL
jgi:hypothetical protein